MCREQHQILSAKEVVREGFKGRFGIGRSTGNVGGPCLACVRPDMALEAAPTGV